MPGGGVSTSAPPTNIKFKFVQQSVGLYRWIFYSRIMGETVYLRDSTVDQLHTIHGKRYSDDADRVPVYLTIESALEAYDD